MKKATLLFAVLLIASASSFGQDYKNGLGVRFGYAYENFSGGVTYKHLVSELIGLEGILIANTSGFLATGLAEIHQPLGDVTGLYWFYGAGGHIGIIDDSIENEFALGVDFILATEYNFAAEFDIPINVTLDWKPAFNIISTTRFWFTDISLSVRYTW